MATKTYQNRYEPLAHNQRRRFIERGYSVSLIAYNPGSDSYDFDVYDEGLDTKLITYKRSGDETRVMFGDQLVGRIVRRQGSDSSPRGGAYRTFHHPITAAGKQLAPCYSRREAVEDLLRSAGITPV